ncbi:MAG: hypothetical protein HZA93_24720 [Verrucomicrobia bacterium]|nr:hypothetical protein [Verrucomicrobiota bacterium]
MGLAANVTLSLSLAGSPTPAIQWSRNGNPIAGATNATLSFTGISAAQAGTCTATAFNFLGAVSLQLIVLTGSAIPAITAQPASQTVGGTQAISA